MPEFTRVRDRANGYEYSCPTGAVDPEGHEVLDKPAVDSEGRPLPAKPRVAIGSTTETQSANPPIAKRAVRPTNKPTVKDK